VSHISSFTFKIFNYRCSFFAAGTLRELVVLTFDLLILVSGHTWWVTWSTPALSLKILQLSVLEL